MYALAHSCHLTSSLSLCNPCLRSAHTGLPCHFSSMTSSLSSQGSTFLPFLPGMLFTQILAQLVPKHHSDLSLHVTFAERISLAFLFKIFVPQPLPFYSLPVFFFFFTFCYLPFYLFIYIIPVSLGIRLLLKWLMISAFCYLFVPLCKFHYHECQWDLK